MLRIDSFRSLLHEEKCNIKGYELEFEVKICSRDCVLQISNKKLKHIILQPPAQTEGADQKKSSQSPIPCFDDRVVNHH
jgi:hypothetical protein